MSLAGIGSGSMDGFGPGCEPEGSNVIIMAAAGWVNVPLIALAADRDVRRGVAIVGRRPRGQFPMPAQTPLYDLVLLLSTTSEADERTKILSDIETAISSAGGSLERNQEWGTRPMTYQIDHQPEAEYHLLQFTGPTTLLESLTHSLGISDTVLRFRIIKVIPGTPPPSDSSPPVIAPTPAAASVGGGGGGRGGEDPSA